MHKNQHDFAKPERIFLMQLLIDIICNFICYVTIWNKHLLSSIPLTNYINYTGFKIRKELNCNDIIGFIQYLCIILSNGIRYKNLKHEWYAVLLKDKYIEKTKKIFDNLQNDLCDFQIKIPERNKKRRIDLLTCYPPELQSSICL